MRLIGLGEQSATDAEQGVRPEPGYGVSASECQIRPCHSHLLRRLKGAIIRLWLDASSACCFIAVHGCSSHIIDRFLAVACADASGRECVNWVSFPRLLPLHDLRLLVLQADHSPQANDPLMISSQTLESGVAQSGADSGGDRR